MLIKNVKGKMQLARRAAQSGVGGHLGEAFGGDDGGESDHGVVAEVEEEAGEDSASAGPGEGEDNADGGEHGD